MSGIPTAIIQWTNGRSRLAVPGHRFGLPPLSEPLVRPVPIPEVDIVAFAEDSVLSGRIRLAGERVSDLLNDTDEFSVTDALVEDLVDGHAIAIRELLLMRDEVFVVDAAGPRGDEARRRRTCQHPVIAKAGPYEVFGYVHTMPGSDPIASLRLRKSMVAMTDAVIGYTVGSEPHLRRANVVMLNQDRRRLDRRGTRRRADDRDATRPDRSAHEGLHGPPVRLIQRSDADVCPRPWMGSGAHSLWPGGPTGPKVRLVNGTRAGGRWEPEVATDHRVLEDR